MTTPKRNEAVAPVAWAFQMELGELRNFEEFDCLLARNPDLGQSIPLYPASAIDALQGEVSRLRALSRELYEAVREAQPFVEYAAMNAQEPRLARQCCDAINAARESFSNLEPPTDGR